MVPGVLADQASGTRSTKGRLWWLCFTARGAALIGTASAFVIVRRRSRPVAALEGLLAPAGHAAPLLIGASLLTTIAAAGVALSLMTVTVGHLVYVIPYVVVVVVARLRSVNLEPQQAARDLGAGPLRRSGG